MQSGGPARFRAAGAGPGENAQRRPGSCQNQKLGKSDSPEDVDVFERETAEAHEAEERHGYTERPGACGVVLYIRNDLPPLLPESSREDFLEHARETARQEPLEIHAFVMTDGTEGPAPGGWATTPGCVALDLGWDVLRECWTPCGDERDPDCPRHGTGDGEAVDENAADPRADTRGPCSAT